MDLVSRLKCREKRCEWNKGILEDLGHQQPFLLENTSTPICNKRFEIECGAQRTYPDGKYFFWWIQCWVTLQGPSSCSCRNSELWQIGRHNCWNGTYWTSLSGAFCRQKSKRCLMLIWAPSMLLSPWKGAG
jgi:hypothetical protein